MIGGARPTWIPVVGGARPRWLFSGGSGGIRHIGRTLGGKLLGPRPMGGDGGVSVPEAGKLGPFLLNCHILIVQAASSVARRRQPVRPVFLRGRILDGGYFPPKMLGSPPDLSEVFIPYFLFSLFFRAFGCNSFTQQDREGA